MATDYEYLDPTSRALVDEAMRLAAKEKQPVEVRHRYAVARAEPCRNGIAWEVTNTDQKPQK